MKKIDYVIISSNDDPLYKDFYPIVAKRWLEIGLKTYYINITDRDEIIENEFGIIHKIKSLDFVSSGFQSQVVRIFASKFFEGNMLTSDIDMLPLNREYYNQYNSELTDDNVIAFTGLHPYYPMCYVLSHTSNFRKYLEIEDLNFEEFCLMLNEKYGSKWNTDEHFMFDQFQKYLDKIVLKQRDLSRRIDRSFWTYDIRLLQSGYYIDSHLLRPYSQYKRHIDELLTIMNKCNL
jgi:hypothetical protein